jgi:hypothetical protein
LGPSLIFVEADGSPGEGRDGDVAGAGSDEEEGTMSGDESDGGVAENGGSGGGGTGYDTFTTPSFADSWKAWEREGENEQREENLGPTFFEKNDTFDLGEPPLESVLPWEIGQPTLYVGNLTSALAEAAGESEGAIAAGGKEEALGEACNSNNFSGLEALLEELSSEGMTAEPGVGGANTPSEGKLGADEKEGVACLLALRRPFVPNATVDEEVGDGGAPRGEPAANGVGASPERQEEHGASRGNGMGGLLSEVAGEEAAMDQEGENAGAVPAKKRDPWSGVSTVLAMPKVVKAKKRKVAFTKDWSESWLLISPEFEAACQEEEKRKEADEAEKERKRIERDQKASESEARAAQKKEDAEKANQKRAERARIAAAEKEAMQREKAAKRKYEETWDENTRILQNLLYGGSGAEQQFSSAWVPKMASLTPALKALRQRIMMKLRVQRESIARRQAL